MNSFEELAKKTGILTSDFDGKELSYLFSIILKLQSEGSTLLLKVDGERNENTSTVIISDGPLGDGYIRYEAENIVEAAKQACNEYCDRFSDY